MLNLFITTPKAFLGIYRYTYNVLYTLEGSNKRYQAYTKEAKNVANFYQFWAKNALDSRRNYADRK